LAKEGLMKREERKRKEQTLLHELISRGGLKPDIIRAWSRETRRKKSAFYDRLAELPEVDRVRYESLPDHRMLDSKLLEELVICIEDDDEIYKANLKLNPEEASRPMRNEVCEWWCRNFDETVSSFDLYWSALPQEIRDLVNESAPPADQGEAIGWRPNGGDLGDPTTESHDADFIIHDGDDEDEGE
jgi:hypothetical protein